jgi:surface antigen
MVKFRNAGLAAAVAASLALGACADVQNNPKTAVGTLGGAAVGGLLGAQVGRGTGQLAATAAGALIGAYAGSEIGRSLDRADRLTMQQTTQTTLERGRTGVASTWRNPDTGNYGSVTPIRTTEATNGAVCREYQQTITVGGRTEEGVGTACRQPDASWRIVR